MRRFIVGLALTVAAVTPSWALGDDQKIAEEIVQKIGKLKQSGQLRGFDIDLQVDNGTVWMKGLVTSEEQQAKALDVAARVAGVRQVVNDLDVKESDKPTVTPAAPARLASEQITPAQLASETRREPEPGVSTDQQIANEIAEKLNAVREASNWKGLSIDLKVLNGDVVLRGHVQNQEQLMRTLDISRRIPGVRQVVNGLLVAGRPTHAQFAQVSNTQPLSSASDLSETPQLAPVPSGPPAGYYGGGPSVGAPVPIQAPGQVSPARFDHPQLPGYSWPSYAAHPNYAAVTYPRQYSPAAWPYIGPFYPYPQVPLGWRKVSLEWDDGWWFLDFKDKH